MLVDNGNHIWKKLYSLGSGAAGAVHLWVTYDATTMNILDRMAVKHVDGSGIWHRDATWFDWHTNGGPGGIPAEIAAHRVLAQEPTCAYVTDYRGSHVGTEDQQWWRICMSDMQFGSCKNYMNEWLDANTVSSLPPRMVKGSKPNKDKDTRMPETFFMDIFAALLTACQFMANRNIFHNDMKASNICIDFDPVRSLDQFFPDEPTEEQFSWQLKPVVIDLGTVRPIVSTQFVNPDSLLGVGSFGYRAPEQCRAAPGAPLSLLPGTLLGEKSMIFSCACSIFTMMHPNVYLPQFHETVPEEQPCPYADLYAEPMESNEDMSHIRKQFQRRLDNTTSAEDSLYLSLTRMLIKCLRFNPDARPTFEEALAEIKLTRPEYAGPRMIRTRGALDHPGTPELSFHWPRSLEIETLYDPDTKIEYNGGSGHPSPTHSSPTHSSPTHE
jgi:serine/threonine protein kinase